MIIRMLSPGAKPTQWQHQGFLEYARRLAAGVSLELREMPLARAGSAKQNREREARRLLEAIPSGSRVVALDRSGQGWDTRMLAARLQFWQEHTSLVCLVIGGPDGLATECLDRADEIWSLSPLTFPHMLVRILVAEQIYRAWSFNHGHPYHRES